MKRPNVLLLVADQFRGDCLGIAGHPDVKTPFLDTLAEKGARFARGYSATPSCIPARASLMTGMNQRHHGRVGYRDGVPWPYASTLAGCFSGAGYQTACVGKMHAHPLRARLGFDEVHLHDGFLHHYRDTSLPYCQQQQVADDYFYELAGHGHRDVVDTGLECNGGVARPWPYEESLHPTRWVGDRALDFFRRRDRDQPFFLMASFVRPHPPFDAPACFFDMYRHKALRPPVVGDWAAPLGPRIQDSAEGIADPELQREAQIGYYACITQLDHQVGRLLERLRVEGELDNTYVLFTADHGELLGDHHLFRKSLPYEGSAHVPFLLAGPGIAPATLRQEVVDLQDVMPTLLDACGLPLPASCDGLSVLPLLGGAPAWREALHGEHLAMGGSVHFIIAGSDKYIWFSKDGREQYFNLAEDPEELHDLRADAACAARLEQLRGLLMRALRGREEGYTDGERLFPGRPCAPILREVFG